MSAGSDPGRFRKDQTGRAGEFHHADQADGAWGNVRCPRSPLDESIVRQAQFPRTSTHKDEGEQRLECPEDMSIAALPIVP